MSDAQWGDEELAPKKKSIPTWVWFCSGGCLLVVLVLAIGGIFAANFVNTMMDSDEQWPKLNEILPFDERPPELEMKAGFSLMGQAQFTLLDNRGFMAQIQSVPGTQGKSMGKQMFDSETPKLMGNFGMLEFANVQKGTLDVQGRALRVVRMEMKAGSVIKAIPGVDEEDADESMGHVAYVELTREGEGGMTWLHYARRHGGEAITDAELQAFFKPFHVGPNR